MLQRMINDFHGLDPRTKLTLGLAAIVAVFIAHSSKTLIAEGLISPGFTFGWSDFCHFFNLIWCLDSLFALLTTLYPFDRVLCFFQIH